MFRNLFEYKKENKVKKSYYEALEDCYEFANEMKYIEKIVKEDSEEFENLVNLFRDLTEDTVDEIGEKLWLANILSDMEYQPVKEFLIRVLENPFEEPKNHKLRNVQTSRENKITAACYLIKFDDVRGKDFLEEFIKRAREDEKGSIFDILVYIGTKVSMEFVSELAKKDEHIKSALERYNKLKEMAKQGLLEQI